MQRELSLITKKIKPWIKKEGVLDVVIFGSFLRGKTIPNDIDLCILIDSLLENKSIDLVDSLSKIVDGLDKLGFKFQINILTTKDFTLGNSIAKTLIEEGYSIKKEKGFSTNFGFVSCCLFIYSLKDFSASKRVRFHYLLNGRYDMKGILKEVNGEIIGAGVIKVPFTSEDLLKKVFDSWAVKYKIERILIS